MRRAARRGVRVDLVLQGQPDMAIVRGAASLLHAHLVAAGLRGRLDELIEYRCRAVEVQPPGPLLARWISLRNAIVFHFLRRFPRWARQLPAQAARVASLQAKGT